ncbi:MAG: PD-(D/E)XK nuclease family protein [Endomicrobium sp.]|jgi:hypothetical protein|nr:PD-(D/E)XK nuclease family protein [Endomicrobium sp.]
MPGKIINVDIYENIICFIADYILKLNKKVALISSNERRVFLFLKNELAQKKGRAFFSPDFFTNNEFIENIIFEKTEFIKISDIEAAFIIFKIIKNNVPGLLNGCLSFASFMEWSFEILSFIEQLDLENIFEDKLKDIKLNAEIGYDIPQDIKNLLENIFKIRRIFHNNLEKSLKITKGYSFLKVALMKVEMFAEYFDEIILITPFYLHNTELEIFKKLYNIGKLTVFIHGNPKEYEILENLYSAFGESSPEIKNKKNEYKLNVYSSFDDQSQGALLKNLIRTYDKANLNKTVVIVPDSKMLKSVISEISIITDNYNISAGYPAEKTTIFSLFNTVIDSQLSRKGKYYYSKDVIKILTNPLLKKMKFFGENLISKTIVHKIENALYRDSKSYLNGKMFISFDEIINNKKLINEMKLTITQTLGYISYEKIIKTLNEIFKKFFISWENIESFSCLSILLSKLLDNIYSISVIDTYPLNIEAMEILLSLSKELKFGELSKEKFNNKAIFNILKKLIKNKRIALSGFPLKGLQILESIESANPSFENVFVVGMKDSTIPTIKKDYPLIPKDIMYALGIKIVKKECEIQQYHFNKLIASAKNLNLIYPDNDKDERSRFIESIIWNKQLSSKNINAVKINKFVLPKFSIKNSFKQKYKKTKEIREYLKNISYTYDKIDTYLNCKLKFYFMYVLSLSENTEIGQEISNKDIGNFIHSFLKNALYEKLDIKKLQSLEFEKDYLKKLKKSFDSSTCFQFREDSFMIKEILIYKMKNILYYEKQRTYKNIYACEKKYASNIKTGSGEIYNLDSRIDRIDRIDTDSKNYMIFDYKTNETNNDIIKKKYFDLLTNNLSRHNIKKVLSSLQLPLYKYIFEKETGFNVIECGIYSIKTAKIVQFPKEKEIYEKCIEILKILLDEITSEGYFEFNEENDRINCKVCKYFYICR